MTRLQQLEKALEQMENELRELLENSLDSKDDKRIRELISWIPKQRKILENLKKIE